MTTKETTIDKAMAVTFQGKTLKTFSELVHSGKLPERPHALGPDSVYGKTMLWDLSTLRIEAFHHKLAGKIIDGVRVDLIDPETMVIESFMTASMSIVEQVKVQILPFVNELDRYLPVRIVGTPHSTDPERTVFRLE